MSPGSCFELAQVLFSHVFCPPIRRLIGRCNFSVSNIIYIHLVVVQNRGRLLLGHTHTVRTRKLKLRECDTNEVDFNDS